MLVEKSGIPVAGLVSADDVRRLEQFDRERAERFSIIDDMCSAYAGVPTEEIEREAACALDEVHEEMRCEARDSATHT